MKRKSVILEVADDGTVTIPADLTNVLGLSPHETVTVEARGDALVIELSRQARIKRIGELLRTALAGVPWSEIEAGRRDRWF